MELVRDHGCRYDLLWRIDGAGGLEGLPERLIALGWVSEEGSPLLITLRKDGDQVVFAPSSGRVRIRVNPERPEVTRAAVATRLFELIRG